MCYICVSLQKSNYDTVNDAMWILIQATIIITFLQLNIYQEIYHGVCVCSTNRGLENHTIVSVRQIDETETQLKCERLFCIEQQSNSMFQLTIGYRNNCYTKHKADFNIRFLSVRFRVCCNNLWMAPPWVYIDAYNVTDSWDFVKGKNSILPALYFRDLFR